jgi:DNA-binding transcriptional LysR family regulator
MRMLDVNALVVFARVVEAASFSQAARRLNMPVSTVSRRIADLEDQLGVRLVERSSRNLRVTEVGAEILEHARRTVELCEAVDSLVSDKLSRVSGILRLSAPPSISDSLLTPLVTAFQTSYPDVRMHILIVPEVEQIVDLIVEGIDIAFHIGSLDDSGLIARKVISFRHQLVASPDYVRAHPPLSHPRELNQHRLLAFSKWRPEVHWSFTEAATGKKEDVRFTPDLAMNDFVGLNAALVAGAGIGDSSPIVQPELARSGKLVEVMPQWRFPVYDLWLVHLGNRHIARHVRLFKEFALQMTPVLFPSLPR